MDDVERLFRYLVTHLAATAPTRLREPFQVAELYQTILPYRHFRRELGFETVQDYEMALLRLLAGEQGYVMVDPVNVQETLQLESEAIAPETGAFRQFAAATVRLHPRAVRAILEDEDSAYAPPPPAPPEGEGAEDAEAAGAAATLGGPDAAGGLVFEAVHTPRVCTWCGGPLPLGRQARFCPHCGQQLIRPTCEHCGEPLEEGWRFCLGCGRPVGR